MQSRSPFFDEIAKAMENAMGLAQTAGEEAKAAFRAQGDRLAAEFDLVRRDVLDAMRAALEAEITTLRSEIAQLKSPAANSPPQDDLG
jgi:BMFP domain-containing protein YqiC